MNDENENQDRQLRELLAATGSVAEKRAPSFQRTWSAVQRARTGTSRPTLALRPGWAFAAVAMALLIMIGGWHWLQSRPDVSRLAGGLRVNPIVGEEADSGVDAQLPTDFLLAANRDSGPASVAQLADEINDLLRP